MKTFISLLCILFLCACGDTAKREMERTKIVVAIDATLVPMTFMNDKNELDGFEIDLMRETARAGKFDIEFVNVEWTGLFGGLITKKYDMVISSVTILDERKQRMAFSIPYLKSGLALVVRKDMEGVNSLTDAENKGLLVGAQVGTTSYFFLDKHPGIRKKGYQQYGHAIADLIKGDIDAVVGESSGTLYYKNQQNEYFQKLKMAGEILTEEYYGIVLRQEDKALMQKVNQALTQLLSDGTVQKLHAKWDLGKAATVPTNK
jgi:polar amino acid transport system substrate-binding protein